MDAYSKQNPRTRAKNKYNNANYSQLNLRLSPNIVEGLKIYCNIQGLSQRELISQLICEKIERDTGKSFDEFIKENQPEQEQHQEQDQENADND